MRGLDTVLNAHEEYLVELGYHKIITDSLNASIRKEYRTDGIIKVKTDKGYVMGILEAKFTRTINWDWWGVEKAFVQALWYAFKVNFKTEFIILGSNKFFTCIYLKEYPELVDAVYQQYLTHKTVCPSSAWNHVVYGPEFSALSAANSTEDNIQRELELLKKKLNIINLNMFLKIRSKNTTCAPLRKCIQVQRPTVLRLGSTTPLRDIFSPRQIANAKEINSIEGCIISGNKLKMKKVFDEAGVITAKWMPLEEGRTDYADELEFPAIIKHIHSSKGNGIYYIKDEEALSEFCEKHKNLDEHIIEEYKNYVREYRLHVTEDGCFYTCRKMIKEGAEERWHRHENNSVWILEENAQFDKPKNWDAIVAECIKAMKATKLDVCAIDVKVQSSKKANPEFIILETNSAPALGEVGIEKYKEQLIKMTR